MVPWFLIFFCFFIIVFQTRIRYNDKVSKRRRREDSLLTDDYQSNFSRARPLDEDMIICLLENDLPFGAFLGENEEIKNLEAKIKKNLEKPIVNTKIDTNIEIKQRFGLKNLQYVIDGEENFHLLIKNLNMWADCLIKEKAFKEAETVLEKAVLIGSDVSQTYILLYKLYNEQGKTYELTRLTERINSLPEISKSRVNKSIKGECTEQQ